MGSQTQCTSLTLNFSYGSNIWMEQMKSRCPESRFVGVAVLRDWRWFINKRGVANVSRSMGDEVFGLIYEVNAADEAVLDRYEGVPTAYQKLTGVPVEIIRVADDAVEGVGDIVDTLVYLDGNNVTDGAIRQEYIARMHKVMKDGVREGIPEEYFEKYFKPFVPPLESQHA